MINMYITMLPLIISGILNMIFTKTKFYKTHKYPIDCYKNYKDNKRIFGDNKTIIGFISMIIFSIASYIIWGYICQITNITNRNEWYILYQNNFIFNSIIGFLVGFTYVLFELPNSFIKRRLNIVPGKTDTGLKGIIFFIIDQIDSLLGVFLILLITSKISIIKYFLYLLLGAGTHILVNLILYILKIRRNL